MMTQTKPTSQPANPPQTRGTAPAQTQPTAAPETKPAPVIDMHEAPYSWNVSAQDENGFIEMFTVRAVSETGFMERVARVKAQLTERGYKPAPARGAHAANAAQTHSAETQTDPAPICAIHKAPMQERTGRNGQKFWSCPQRLDTGEFCPYRPPKQ